MNRIASILLVASALVMARDNTIQLSFTELDSLLSNSPVYHSLDYEFSAKMYDVKHHLNWQNPEFEFEREALSDNGDKENETVFLLGKDFMLPWAGYYHRSAQNAELEAIGFSLKDNYLFQLNTFKSQYIALSLLQQKSRRYIELDSLMNKALNIAQERFNQGTLSGVENRLVQLSKYNVQRDRFVLQQEYKELLAQFKTGLGFGVDDSLEFSTDIAFLPFGIKPLTVYTQELEKHPILTSFAVAENAKKQQVRFEKLAPVSSVHLSGGYKQLNDTMDGYVAGISIPLPILNRNKTGIQKTIAELNQLQIENQMTTRKLNLRLEQLVAALKIQQKQMKTFSESFQSAAQIIDDIVYTFYEGSADFGDILDTYQVYTESMSTYYDQLLLYYNYLLELEYLTQEKIIEF